MPGLEPKIYLLRLKNFFSRNQSSPLFYCLIAVFVFQLASTLLQCHDLVDDAYISARYARNLAQGFGLVYNRVSGAAEAEAQPGREALQRVEGYSNFLWVLLLALGWKLGFNMRFISQFLGIISGLLSTAFLFLWVKKETRGKWLALTAAGFLATNLYFAVWNVQGLETPLFCLLIITAIYALSVEKKKTAIGLALLAALTRPDGILLFAAVAVIQFRDWWKSRGQFQPTARNWLIFIGPYLFYFFWRSVYYRSFLPNTFYAKTGLGWAGFREGLIYLADFFLHNPLALIFCVMIVVARFYVKEKLGPVRMPATFALSYLAFLFLAGGDWMPGYRLAVPLLPVVTGAVFIIACLIWKTEGVNSFSKKLINLLRVIVSLFLLLQVYGIARYLMGNSFDKNWHQNQAKFYRPTAEWLRKYVWQNQTIAAGDIGYIGYFGDHDRIIDTMGLVDRHLGRLPGISSLTTDLDYIFDQNPFCIVTLVHKYPAGAELGHSEFDRQLALDKRFTEKYRLVHQIYGWTSQELSRTDWKQRTSQVYFKIYFNNQI